MRLVCILIQPDTEHKEGNVLSWIWWGVERRRMKLIFQELLLRLANKINKITQVTIRYPTNTLKHCANKIWEKSTLCYITFWWDKDDMTMIPLFSVLFCFPLPINFVSHDLLYHCKIVYSVRIPLSIYNQQYTQS